MAQHDLTVNAEDAGTLMVIPGFGRVLVSASNPASSSLTRFKNDTSRSLLLSQQVTDGRGRMTSNVLTLAAGRIHNLPLDATAPGLDNWTVIWGVRPGAMSPGVRISMTIRNGPRNMNVVEYSGRDDPA